MKTDLTEEDFRKEVCSILKKMKCFGVVHHGHFGNYFIYGRWEPKDQIIKIYQDRHPYEHMDEVLKFADHCIDGEVFSAIYEEFDDKYSPYMAYSSRVGLNKAKNSKFLWSDIYEIVNRQYLDIMNNVRKTEIFE